MILVQVAIKAHIAYGSTKCWLISMQILRTRFDRHWAHISMFMIQLPWFHIFFRNQRSLIQILLLKSSSFEMIALFWSTINEKLQLDIWESLILQAKITETNEIKTDLSNLTKKVSLNYQFLLVLPSTKINSDENTGLITNWIFTRSQYDAFYNRSRKNK